MIKRIYLILVVGAGLAAAQPAVAQDQPASSGQTFTLQQCIDYALENGILTRNAKLDEQMAESKVRETVGIGLPQINASATVMHNEKLPRFFTTYTGAGGFIDLSGVPGIEVGDVVAAENFFQLKSSGDVGLSVNQIIFNGSYIVGLQASQAPARSVSHSPTLFASLRLLCPSPANERDSFPRCRLFDCSRLTAVAFTIP